MIITASIRATDSRQSRSREEKYRGREVRNNITKCETLLRSSRQIYILENIFTYHKTQLHGKNTFTKDETNLHFRKQINNTQNTFTSPETNLQWQILHGKGMYHTPEVTRWKVLLLVSAVNSCCGCGVNGVNKVYGDRTWTAAEGCFARFVANTWAA